MKDLLKKLKDARDGEPGDMLVYAALGSMVTLGNNNLGGILLIAGAAFCLYRLVKMLGKK